MTNKLPYLPSAGTVPKFLDKIIEAKTPDKFTLDFLGTKLGFRGGSARPIIPLLKRIGFLRDDGSSTELYRQFRTESGRGAAMAKALKIGYSEAFERNDYASDLDRPKFKDLIYSITGAERGNTVTEQIVSTFFNFKEYADFEADETTSSSENLPTKVVEATPEPAERRNSYQSERSLGLSYTININLPETTNVDVYNAIFEAIDRKLLK